MDAKKAFKLFLLTVAVFLAVTIFTAEFESALDGNDSFGFPLRFFEYTNAKMAKGFKSSSFNIFYLFADIFIAFIVSICSTLAYKSLKKLRA